MKRVPLKKVPLVTPTGEDSELDYLLYLEIAIKNPLNGQNADIEENRKSIRLLDALEKAEEDGVDMEDADYEYLCTKVKALRFNWIDPAFVQFVEDVTEIE